MCSERQMSTIDEKKCIQMSDFDCVYCGLIFQSTQELADHQTKHQSERPFICPICNRMFQEYGQAVVTWDSDSLPRNCSQDHCRAKKVKGF